MNIKDFKGFDVEIDLNPITKKHAHKLAKQINQNIAGRKWTGNYANSWTVNEKDAKPFNVYTVYTDEYRLTHLLENGHLIVNKKGGVGWSAPRPHVKESAQKEIESFKREVSHIKVKLRENKK